MFLRSVTSINTRSIITAIVTLFALTVIVDGRRIWKKVAAKSQLDKNNNSSSSSSSKNLRGEQSKNVQLRDGKDIYVALDEQEAAELYGAKGSRTTTSNQFSSLEGEFEWNQFKVSGFLNNEDGDNVDKSNKFYIVSQKDVERRLEWIRRKSDIAIQDDSDNKVSQDDRDLKTYYHDGSYVGRGDDNDYDGIYAAGDIRNYSLNSIVTLLRNHEYVAFTRKWRGNDHLIVTQQCSIKYKSEPGAYYCVDNKTVCVTVKSMSRFFGDHVGGGPCGLLPLDEHSLAGLPETFQEAYVFTCDGNHCDGGR
jgi:hypothetical protein